MNLAPFTPLTLDSILLATLLTGSSSRGAPSLLSLWRLIVYNVNLAICSLATATPTPFPIELPTTLPSSVLYPPPRYYSSCQHDYLLLGYNNPCPLPYRVADD